MSTPLIGLSMHPSWLLDFPSAPSLRPQGTYALSTGSPVKPADRFQPHKHATHGRRSRSCKSRLHDAAHCCPLVLLPKLRQACWPAKLELKAQQGRRTNRQLPHAAVSARDAQYATQQLQGILAGIEADPALAPLLHDPEVAAAIRQISAEPTHLQAYVSNPKVMGVLERLLGRDLTPSQAQAFSEAGTTPSQMLIAMTANAELSNLLNHPKVRTALADIRANPAIGMARWESDPLVGKALDLLEQAMRHAGDEATVDVEAETVQQLHTEEPSYHRGQNSAAKLRR